MTIKLKTAAWALALFLPPLTPLPALAGGYTLTTLVTFNGVDGVNPHGGVTLDTAGNLYGTTAVGGASGAGTVFKIDAATGTLSTLASFDHDDGSYPVAGVTLDAAGNLYGTTTYGGANGDGNVFKIDAATGALSTLVSFTNTNGSLPGGGVTLDAAGNIYGTTQQGGASGDGTVFKIDAATGALSTLASFTDTNGNIPLGGVTLDAIGNIYGTTFRGGASGAGTVFKIDAATGTLSTLVSFDNYHWGYPMAGVTLDAAGNIYGTTEYGGTNDNGTVFRIDAATGALSTLASFTDANGSDPRAGVTLDAAGNLYGTTTYGGANGDGTVFKIDAATGALSTLVSFNGANGRNPVAGVTLDAAGNIYGTTQQGGGGAAGEVGTVFRLSPNAAAVPEPAGLLMLGLGAAGLGLGALRRKPGTMGRSR